MAFNASTQCVSIHVHSKAWDLTNRRSVIAVTGVLYSLTILAAVAVNTLCIVAIARTKSLHTVRTLLLMSLFVIDIVQALFCGVVTPVTILNKNWVFGNAACTIVPLVQGMSIFVCSYTLMTIALDRFLFIVWRKQRPFSPQHALLLAAFIWLLAAAFSTPPAVHMELSSIRHFCGHFCVERWPSNGWMQAYTATAICIQFVVPLWVIGFCYAAIMITHKRSLRTQLQHTAEWNESRRMQLHQRNTRTTYLLIIMVIVFVLCFLPQVVFNGLRDLNILPHLVSKQTHLFALITHWFTVSCTLWNTLLYAALNQQLRKAVCGILPVGCRQRQPTDSQSALEAELPSCAPPTQHHKPWHFRYSFRRNAKLSLPAPPPPEYDGRASPQPKQTRIETTNGHATTAIAASDASDVQL